MHGGLTLVYGALALRIQPSAFSHASNALVHSSTGRLCLTMPKPCCGDDESTHEDGTAHDGGPPMDENKHGRRQFRGSPITQTI